jgi:protein TonB
MGTEPPTPDTARVLAATESALKRAAAEPPSRNVVPESDSGRIETASVDRLSDSAEWREAPSAVEEPATGPDESVAAADSPPPSPEPMSTTLADLTADEALPRNSPPEIAQAQTPSAPQGIPTAAPILVAPEKIASAADQIADLLATLPPRVFARDRNEAAAKQVAAQLAALQPPPPPVIAAEKTAPARDEVASVLAGLPPRPVLKVAAELAPLVKPEGLEGGIKLAALNARAATFACLPKGKPADAKAVVKMPEVAAAPPQAPQAVKVAALSVQSIQDAGPPPPLPRRKPELASPKLAPLAPATEAEATAKAQAVSPQREKQIAAAQPRQDVAQGGGLFGLFKPGTFAKPMTLAPADQPGASASRPSTARPSSGAYASQVWSRLARAKPRAGQHGSASVSFTIGEMGALRAVQLARSSGNSKIDQLALQTVRNAAPFNAPPSGAVSYTIRIDF